MPNAGWNKNKRIEPAQIYTDRHDNSSVVEDNLSGIDRSGEVVAL
jgi:hypothetical protein